MPVAIFSAIDNLCSSGMPQGNQTKFSARLDVDLPNMEDSCNQRMGSWQERVEDARADCMLEGAKNRVEVKMARYRIHGNTNVQQTCVW